MSSIQIDEILNIYKQVAQNPMLLSARIVSSKNKIIVNSVWLQKNLEYNKKQKFVLDFSFDCDLKLIYEGLPYDISSEILTTSSENDELKAVLREVTFEGKIKQFIEIWDKKHFIKSYDLSAYDVHGDVYSTPIFHAFHWSPDNTRLLYVAEKKLPKSVPFYKQKSKPKSKNENEEEPSRGTEYIFKPEWGEQLIGKHRSVVVILNIQEDTIVPLDPIPDEYFPAQVTWAPNGLDIVGVAYKLNPRYLGLMFCTNRESYIFHLQGTEFRKLTEEGLSCKSPRFSPDGKYLTWLEREISPPHHHVHRLAYLKWNNIGKPEILVDVVNSCATIDKNKKFYGIYNENLSKRCWSEDSKFILFSTPQEFNIKSYIVNLETKVVTEIENIDDSSLMILDVKKNFVLFSKSCVLLSSELLIGKFDSCASNIGDLNLVYCTTALEIPIGKSLMYENTKYTYDSNEEVKDFNFTYLGGQLNSEKSMPLIVVPHGGPHSTLSNDFNMGHVIFALLGFGVLHVNYRGSTGMGGNNVEYILGRVGESDVLDCLTAIKEALNKYRWLDPKNVSLFGGSHGGFLSAHLSGQYPDMFNAVVMRNPVIDLAVMFSITDIPDWCSAESGCRNLGVLPETTSESNYPELIKKMLEHSPILHVDKVKAPTLIALGSNDLRVPSSQGKLWFYHLCSNGVITKLLMYDDNHSLTKDEVEIDLIINAIIWIIEHTN